MRGPITPVCREGEPCDEPAKAVLIFSRKGRVIARARSREDGRYRISLAPGIYAVRLPGGPPAVGRGLEPRRVTVSRGRYRRVNFSIDTGIR